MKKYNLDLVTIRHVWSLIETLSSETWLNLNDSELVQKILQQVETRLYLSSQESNTLSCYINSRTKLIRDLTESRLV